MALSHSEKHLRVRLGEPFHLDSIDPAATPGLKKKDKDSLSETFEKMHEELAELQARLWAEHSRSILLVLQALDSGGKDGTIRRVFKGVNPQGVRVTGFRQPNSIEASHDFLWRINKALPAKGEIGIFNRSHYEDVVATYVLKLIDDEERQRRFQEIRNYEDYLDRNNIDVIKVFLHISSDEQRRRFQERIDDPAKQWKFSDTDLKTRELWPEYQDAYSEAISATSTDESPWFVIPANHRWSRDYSILQLLLDRLNLMNPRYPKVTGLEDIVIK
ncbi:MAG: polyphosphate kinase 2 family protein [Actinomycetota bacterium]|nr:MAG: polyphosphate kinase 2 family protein [Actinomycetota bacterium]